jgi:regulator of protease activity HflC (stomatin/prohibitin superfamily)
MKHQNKEKETNKSYLDNVMEAGGSEIVSSFDSLSRALRIGFRLLKVIMIVLAVVFLFSNIYWVPEGYIAVQSRLGDIIGKGAGAIRPPGGPYLAFPYPLDKISRIPTTSQRLSIHNAFWMEGETMEPEIDDRPETQGLNPGVHGSLVTADKNIVQGIWVVHYRLDLGANNTTDGLNAIEFICNVGSMDRAGDIIRRVAQAAIVRVVSQTNVAEFIAGQIDNNEIRRIIGDELSRLDTGLDITSVTASQYSVPRALVSDFQAVTQAESQKALDIETASRHRVSTLNELAGSGWQNLLDAIDRHESDLKNSDRATEKEAFEAIEKIYLEGDLGGTIKQIVDEARSEKTYTIQRARASASRFAELLPSYEMNPDVIRNQMIQDVIKEIWSDISVDTIYIPPGQRLYLDLGRKEYND